MSTQHPDHIAATIHKEEAIHRAMETSEAVVEGRRHGRVEAESRRISEEVTCQAQERLRAQAGVGPAAPHAAEHDAPHRVLPQTLPIRHLLVPLSGVPFAERALPFAETLADLTGATITLTHVEGGLGAHVADIMGNVVDAVTGRSVSPAHADSVAYLQDLRTRTAMEVNGVEIQTARASSVASGLLEVEERACADLVVLATQPHLGRERRLLGTVAPALLRSGRAPLLVIPAAATIPEDHLPSLARVLVPLDGSLLAEQALGPLVALVRGTGERRCGSVQGVREIVLFSVGETRGGLRDGRVYLADVHQLLQHAVPPDVEVRTDVWLGSAPGAIVTMAHQGIPAPFRERPAERAFDLVVMATHGRGGIGNWLFGSVSEYVLAHLDVPILVVHPLSTDDM